MPGEPQKNLQNLICLNIHPANLIRLAYSKINYPPICWRGHVISANTISFGEGDALQEILNVLPVRQDT
jgi:hypothetical protein